MSFHGEVDPERPALVLAGKIDGVQISPEMRNVLPDGAGSNLSVLGSLRGQTEALFQIDYDPAAPQPWKFNVTGQLAGGRIDDPRLPRPLTEINATVHVDNQGFAIQKFEARSNQATLSLTCSGGLKPSSPMAIEAVVRQLPLDDQLRAVLPDALQEEWQKIQPEGLIDARINLGYDGRAWQPQVSIECQNVAFTHREFPYRLDRGKGWLELKDGRLQFDIATKSEDHLVQIVGEVFNPGKSATGWMRITSSELPIDEKLLRALKPQAERWPAPWTSKEPSASLSRPRARSPTGRNTSISNSRPAAAGCATIVFPLRWRMFAARWRCATATGWSATWKATTARAA